MDTLPGTRLPFTEGAKTDAFASLSQIFAVSGGGLLLSQVTELTGLGGSTVQNWVKRGWVSKPVNKRYGELHVARILLINLLRPAMQLEKIADLLRYINGSVDDRTDAIIPATQLYSLLCSAILEMSESGRSPHESIINLTESRLEGYEGPVPDAAGRLKSALSIMLMNVAAASLMQKADEIFERTVAAESGGPAGQ